MSQKGEDTCFSKVQLTQFSQETSPGLHTVSPKFKLLTGNFTARTGYMQGNYVDAAELSNLTSISQTAPSQQDRKPVTSIASKPAKPARLFSRGLDKKTPANRTSSLTNKDRRAVYALREEHGSGEAILTGIGYESLDEVCIGFLWAESSSTTPQALIKIVTRCEVNGVVILPVGLFDHDTEKRRIMSLSRLESHDTNPDLVVAARNLEGVLKKMVAEKPMAGDSVPPTEKYGAQLIKDRTVEPHYSALHTGMTPPQCPSRVQASWMVAHDRALQMNTQFLCYCFSARSYLNWCRSAEVLPTRTIPVLKTGPAILDRLTAAYQVTESISVGFVGHLLADPEGEHHDYEWIFKALRPYTPLELHPDHPTKEAVLLSTLLGRRFQVRIFCRAYTRASNVVLARNSTGAAICIFHIDVQLPSSILTVQGSQLFYSQH
ncbi:hypothetical protein DFH06DRAFT_1300478 [Mycena polygramma]|nr:hypothetical protein DFH06DRAFT_1300478 [Mycena polygramma]